RPRALEIVAPERRKVEGRGTGHEFRAPDLPRAAAAAHRVNDGVRKMMELAGSEHLGMTAEDALDESRAAAWHTHDEDRFDARTAGGGRRLRRKCIHDPLHRLHIH